MRFRKRYVLLLLPLLLIGALQLEFFAFRKSPAAQQAYFLKKGQAQFSFHHYQLGDRRIQYTHVGKEGKPLIVLLHGAPGSSSAFMRYLADPELTEVAQVVAVDRPGNGYSDYGRAMPSLAAQAAHIIPVLDRHPAEKVILLGHSYGGPLIARMAMDYPDRIDHLVMVAGSVDPELEPREWWREPADWRISQALLPESMVVCNQEIMALYDELKQMMPLWEKITCPITVFQGSKDRLVPAGNAHFIQEKAVNSPEIDLQIIEDGSHFILWSEQARMVNRLVDICTQCFFTAE